MNFNYYLPVNLIFGRGKSKEIGKITSQFGKNALVVTGGKSTKSSGVLDMAIKSLNDVEVDSVVFDKVAKNPTTDVAIEGTKISKENKCDVIVGIGGGSVMDTAKAIAFLSLNDGDINDYIFNKISSDKALPIVLMPTTCGTGSEGNGFAVLTNPENNDKKSLRCNSMIAKASIIDSTLMETMPKTVLASVGFDALCHCMEAYISKISQPIVEAISLMGMEMIYKNLTDVYLGKGTDDSWDYLSFASTLGGMAINTAGVTLPHGMEHPASGLKNIVHGQGLAALTPVITKESIKYSPEKYAVISKSLGGTSEKDCVDRINYFLESIDLKIKLSDLGINKSDIAFMTENCFKVSAAGISYHPALFRKEKIKEMYLMAM